MVTLAERPLETVITDAFTSFRDNLSTFVLDIYAQESAANQDQITTWWSNADNNVTVTIGYPTASSIKSPMIAITMEPSNEVAPRRFLGNVIGVTSTNYNYGTTFEATYICHVLATNQNQLLWLQALVKWALMMNRQTLETTYGLLNQRLSLGPLRPIADSMKDVVFPFERTITLNCQHIDTWTPLPTTTVTSTGVTLDVTSG